MERIFRVFISSTFREFQAVRKSIISHILSAGHIPSGMELFSAENAEDLIVIDQAIDKCDIYVILIGATVGSKKDDVSSPYFGKSYTEIEFEIAQSKNKSILGFMLEDSEFCEIENSMDSNDYECLKRLRRSVRGSGIPNYFSQLDGEIHTLPTMIISSINKLINRKDFTAKGLIPYDPNYVNLGIISQDPFMRDIVDRLTNYNLLTKRCTTNEDSKIGMAYYFIQHYMADILDSGIRDLFFESGSTIAYVSSQFLSKWSNTATGQTYLNEWNVRTNNILTYLQAVLTKNIKISLHPYGPPEKRYGATFGKIASLPRYPAPGPEKLPPLAEKTVDEVASSLIADGRAPLFLATASGLDLDGYNPLGPHVGDYYNTLFKLAIFRTKRPVILFFDQTKLAETYNEEHCYSICKYIDNWTTICSSYPLAICIGTENLENRNEIIGKLARLGLTNVSSIDRTKCEKRYKGSWPLIASNDVFADTIARLKEQHAEGQE